MEKEFGKITKQQANNIGRFIDDDGIEFTPFCQEMTDGTYLILKESWDKYNQRKEFNGVSQPVWFFENELEFKRTIG